MPAKHKARLARNSMGLAHGSPAIPPSAIPWEACRPDGAQRNPGSVFQRSLMPRIALRSIRATKRTCSAGIAAERIPMASSPSARAAFHKILALRADDLPVDSLFQAIETRLRHAELHLVVLVLTLQGLRRTLAGRALRARHGCGRRGVVLCSSCRRGWSGGRRRLCNGRNL